MMNGSDCDALSAGRLAGPSHIHRAPGVLAHVGCIKGGSAGSRDRLGFCPGVGQDWATSPEYCGWSRPKLAQIRPNLWRTRASFAPLDVTRIAYCRPDVRSRGRVEIRPESVARGPHLAETRRFCFRLLRATRVGRRSIRRGCASVRVIAVVVVAVRAARSRLSLIGCEAFEA